MTMFLTRIDRKKGLMEWVRAGHDPLSCMIPVPIISANSTAETGSPLGLPGKAATNHRPARLGPGTLFMGTDGIWEARNRDGELFGKDRLQAVISTYSTESARNIALSILDAVEEFRGKEKQEDDLTLVIARITESTGKTQSA